MVRGQLMNPCISVLRTPPGSIHTPSGTRPLRCLKPPCLALCIGEVLVAPSACSPKCL